VVRHYVQEYIQEELCVGGCPRAFGHYVQEYIQEELCVGGCPRAFDFVNITGNAFNTN